MADPKQNTEPKELTSEEKALLEKVSKIVVSLDKNTKSKKFYLPNNPILIKHQDDLVEFFKTFFENEKELTLFTSSTSFTFLGNIVYHNPIKTENFAFKLYNDGIRSITFYDGLTKEELLDFVDTLNKGLKQQTTESEEDLVTLLWEKQFDNIKYKVVENIIDTTAADEGKTTEERIDEVVQDTKDNYYGLGEDYKEIIEIDEVPITFDATNFGEMFKTKGVLGKEEVDNIRQEIDYTEKRENVLADFIDILPHIFQEDLREEEFTKTIHIIQGMMDSCVFRGELIAATKVLEKLKSLPSRIEQKHIPVENIIRTFVKSFANKDKVEDLINSLNLSFTGQTDEITNYIAELHEKIIPILLKSLQRITDSHYRHAVCSGIARIFKGDDPSSFLRYVNTKDTESVRDLIFLLSELKSERVVNLLPHFMSHSQKIIKKESLALLRNYIKSSKSIKILMSSLEDGDIEIRTLTLRILATTGNKEVAKSLLKKISEEDFAFKELIEKKSYFFAAAKILGNDFISFVADILEQRGLVYAKEKMDDFYQCSCFALGIIGTDQAKEVLEKGLRSKKKSLQKYCKSILRKIEMGSR